MTRNKTRKHRIKQKAKCLRTQRCSLTVKFLATANERGQRITQLRCYKDILRNESRYKIS